MRTCYHKYQTGFVLFIILICTIIASPLLSGAEEKKSEPVIVGITSWHEGSLTATGNDYINAVIQAGGVPVLLPVVGQREVIPALVNQLDALILTGGADIDPSFYHEDPIPELEFVDQDRDRFEAELLRQAMKKGLPILGICRGHQLMNVVNGGTLWQDFSIQLTGEIKHRQETARKGNPTHRVTIDKSSRLYKILGRETITVNSIHHQKKVASGFKVVAKTSDGVVEAMEKEDYPGIVSVQWHPEAMIAAGDTVMPALFNYLIEQARKKQSQTKR